MLPILMRRAFGLVALVVGAVLIGWFVYNQIWPTEAFKRGFRSVFQLVLPVLCIAVGWKWVRYDGKGIEEVTPPDLKCPELETARSRAQSRLPEFLAEVEKGIDGAFIKFPLRTPQGLTEHIWAYVHYYKEDQFNVSLANTPIDEKAEAEGRRNVARREVEDWQIMLRDGSIRGAFSVMALFEYRQRQGKKLSPRMKKQRAQLVDFIPAPEPS